MSPARPAGAGARALLWTEAALVALCLWAAWYRTPAGALVRTLGAHLVGLHTSARPLLAYYSAGAYSDKPPAPLRLRGPVPPGEAVAYGAAQLQGRPPREVGRDLDRLRLLLGSEEAAALALFCGEEPVRWALQRAGGRDLESLARELPPEFADRIASASQAIMLGAAYSLSWPLPPATPVTSPFGPREHPVLGGARMHNGVDLGVPERTPVRAVAAGVVRRASSDDSNGRLVLLDHGRGVTTLYCHNDELLVRAGDRVERGQVISRSGNTGRSTGPHLHYQLELAGQPVDPLRYRAARAQPVAPGASD